MTFPSADRDRHWAPPPSRVLLRSVSQLPKSRRWRRLRPDTEGQTAGYGMRAIIILLSDRLFNLRKWEKDTNRFLSVCLSQPRNI